MTIKELYEWAKENNAEELPINVNSGCGSYDRPIATPIIAETMLGKTIVLYPQY